MSRLDAPQAAADGPHYVIIGNGVAGNQAAEVIRDRAPDSRVTILTNSRLLFYNRYLLPRIFLGQEDWRSMLAHPAEHYAQRRIAVRRDCWVTNVDAQRRQITLSHNETIGYDTLLVAAGGRGYLPEELAEFRPLLHGFGSYEQAMTVKRALPEGGTVVMLGGGFDRPPPGPRPGSGPIPGGAGHRRNHLLAPSTPPLPPPRAAGGHRPHGGGGDGGRRARRHRGHRNRGLRSARPPGAVPRRQRRLRRPRPDLHGPGPLAGVHDGLRGGHRAGPAGQPLVAHQRPQHLRRRGRVPNLDPGGPSLSLLLRLQKCAGHGGHRRPQHDRRFGALPLHPGRGAADQPRGDAGLPLLGIRVMAARSSRRRAETTPESPPGVEINGEQRDGAPSGEKGMSGADIQIAICGSAGDGTIAAGDILRNAVAEAGYKVISFDVYPPEIRGFGKCISRLRITTDQAYSLKERSDVLLSLDDSHTIPHVGEVRDFGAVICEAKPVGHLAEGEHLSAHILPGQIPYSLPIRELSEKATGGNRSRNIVALGYVAGLCDLPKAPFLRIIESKFKKQGPKVIANNAAGFGAGYEAGCQTFKLDDVHFAPPARALQPGAKVTILNGNHAVARGCLDARLTTFFGYPITPATTIMERLATELPRHGGRLLQTEDEISAIAAVIGAGYAGSRSATSTSGPGLALMGEMLGLGTIAEVPAVVFVSQRGGPSTGMPTKTEQSDLNAALYGSHGDSQRIVIAPTNVEGCYRCAGKAFEMAERYQTPVIVLLDLYLSNRYETVELSASGPPFELDANVHAKRLKPGEVYQRYVLTDDWVSPRAIPGDPGCMHVITGLEHNALGRPNDSEEMHELMSRKRHEKLQGALRHPDFTHVKRFGDAGKVEVGILAWGSTFGECLEAMIMARAEGIRCSAMKVVMLSPLPEAEIRAFLDDCGAVLVPELNYEGQFAQLVQGRLARPVTRLTRVPGGPMPVAAILAEIRRLAGRC
ncbi:MAG: 2-oxoacid:acceptor oxidoreductase subunit alpha [Magnetococcales bacterium]|nr:2-oxoacid:acceptor oxidoreductase subunit alpha [Magnetococcales bacterium]